MTLRRLYQRKESDTDGKNSAALDRFLEVSTSPARDSSKSRTVSEDGVSGFESDLLGLIGMFDSGDKGIG